MVKIWLKVRTCLKIILADWYKERSTSLKVPFFSTNEYYFDFNLKRPQKYSMVALKLSQTMLNFGY